MLVQADLIEMPRQLPNVRIKKLIKKRYRIRYGKHRPSLPVQVAAERALKQNTVRQKEMRLQNYKVEKQLLIINYR